MATESGPPTWTSNEGLNFLQATLNTILTQWPEGPHNWQVKATANILCRQDQLVIAGCGEGKTAAMYLHLLVHRELARTQEKTDFAPNLCIEHPVVLNVTPLTDLAHSQVSHMMVG